MYTGTTTFTRLCVPNKEKVWCLAQFGEVNVAILSDRQFYEQLTAGD